MFRGAGILTFLVFLGMLQSCYKEEIVFESDPASDLSLPFIIKFDNKECFYDCKLNLLRYALESDTIMAFSPFVEFQEYSEIFFESQKLENGQPNNLGMIRVNKSYNLKVKTGGAEKSIKLVFTNLPQLRIVCDSEIYDEPKSLAKITINYPADLNSFSAYAGIEHRGKFSRTYKKRSYGFSLWEEMVNEKFSASLIGLQENNDWILTAAYNDPSRIRNMVSFNLWNQMAEDLNEGSGIKVDCLPVEVTKNNYCQGIYIFSGNINIQLLNGGEESVLYKAEDWADGAVKFECFDPEISQNKYWNGWEQKLSENGKGVDWKPLLNLYQLAVNGSDQQFANNISKLINIPNFIDYYILLNLTSAFDNTGKNVYLYKKEENSPFQIIPWDLDGSWGINYNGEEVGPSSTLTSHLFDRLYDSNPGNYRPLVKIRWEHLRSEVLSDENIKSIFSQYFRLLRSTDIIQIENTVWDINLDMEDSELYITNWIDLRLEFLDNFFADF